jgi:hypothetical protein
MNIKNIYSEARCMAQRACVCVYAALDGYIGLRHS